MINIEYKYGPKIITGKAFYSECPKCNATGWVDEDVPSTEPASAEELSEMAKKHARENTEFSINNQIMNHLRNQFPGAFR